MWISLVVFLGVGALALAVHHVGPVVKVKQGKLRGTQWTTKGGRTIYAFQSIPYAKPPLNALRFEPPVPADSWSGIRNATEVHAICPQRDIFRRSDVIQGDEDCLYLNVYTPQIESSKKHQVRASLPVMIFFHGGGWLCGGGNSHWYGPDVLLDHDVVLVVPNYRLGALGFLTTGDKIVPGNNGLKDQNLAMKWVKDNIRQFAGNPNLITIFGESAGGASVHLHMLSRMSKGLFHAAISQSGTAQCSWGFAPNDQGVRHGLQLAEALNCTTETNKAMVQCLRKISAYDIVDQDKVFMKWDTDPMIPFKPVLEPNLKGAFLKRHPVNIIKSGRFNQVPWIVGLNTEDGALRAAGIFGTTGLSEELDKNFTHIVPISLLYDETAHSTVYITDAIRKFYLHTKKITEFTKNEIVNMYTDAWFLHGIDESVRYYLKYSKKPVYYYLFGYRGSSSFTEIFGDNIHNYGVCHADELQYLFPVSDGLFPRTPQTPDDRKMTKMMTSLWVNFAKHGNPTPKTSELLPHEWLPVKTEDGEHFYLNVEGAQMRSGLLKDRVQFWRSLPVSGQVNIPKDNDDDEEDEEDATPNFKDEL